MNFFENNVHNKIINCLGIYDSKKYSMSSKKTWELFINFKHNDIVKIDIDDYEEIDKFKNIKFEINVKKLRKKDLKKVKNLYKLTINSYNYFEKSIFNNLKILHICNISEYINFENLTFLKKLDEIKLFNVNNYNYTDLFSFNNIKRIYIIDCHNIKLTKYIENVKKIYISNEKYYYNYNYNNNKYVINCKYLSLISNISIINSNIINETYLKNAHYINLSYTNITDISKFGDVHTLNIKGCSMIKNIFLENNIVNLHYDNKFFGILPISKKQETCDLGNCKLYESMRGDGSYLYNEKNRNKNRFHYKCNELLNYNINNIFHKLLNMITLNISFCYIPLDIDFTLLTNIKNLNISYTNIKNVSMFNNLDNLNVECCKNITNLSLLYNVHTINAKYCKKIKFTKDKRLKEKKIEWKCKNIYLDECNVSDISMFGNTEILSIQKCKNIIKLPKKMNMHTLNIRNCNFNKPLSGDFLKNIKTIII